MLSIDKSKFDYNFIARIKGMTAGVGKEVYEMAILL